MWLMESNSRLKAFRYVPEARGGTFTVDEAATNSLQSIPRFGTYDCHTCVGVWWPIDDKRCFVAHISCAFADTRGGLTWDVRQQWERDHITFWVKAMLNTEQRAAKWGRIQSHMKDRIVLICPRMTSPPSEHLEGGAQEIRNVGYCIVQAIKEWVGVPNATVDSQHGGFIVEHPRAMVAWRPCAGMQGTKSDQGGGQVLVEVRGERAPRETVESLDS